MAKKAKKADKSKNGRDQLKCPVCTRVEMEKLEASKELGLTLDYCDKCGGMWFDSGEVRQLHLCSPDVLGGRITLKKQLFTVECRSCRRSMTRNSAECPECGHANIIKCPCCKAELERVQGEAFTVDVCKDCRGVWFDNMDLSQVWNLEFSDNARARDPDKDSTTGRGEDTVAAVLRASKGEDGAENGRNVFGRIANIIGGVLPAE